ncbi:MAG: LysR substrate-binding domain-containing protein [Novosphingobium sp.]|nr:LysR substrate-binding domain-containing protein [Novosphingobium sp.]
MQGVDWSDYQAFLAIARAGQLARAAAALRVDATTVGRRLRRLEARLGATLFEQTREGQVLTEAGERLLAAVEQMAQAASGISEESGDGGLSGTLRISVSEGFGTWFLANRLPEFADSHPGLTLDLVASTGFLSPSKREADIAVVLSRPKAGPVIARKLSDYALRLYACPAYLAEAGTPGRAADLAQGHRLVGYIPDLLYAPELRYLDEIHPGLAATIRSSSISAQQRLLAQGAGIGVLPCFMGDGDPALVPVLPERRIARTFWIVTHKDTHNLARVRAGAKWLAETVAQHRALLLPGD